MIDFTKSYTGLQDYFSSGATKPIEARRAALNKILAWINSHEQEIYQALHLDFKKPKGEVYITEIAPVIMELKHTLKNLNKWASKRKVGTNVLLQPAKSYILPQPKGVVMIISPWNYPFYLALTPLIPALAAGNCVCLKTAHETPNTSALLKQMVTECFPPDYVYFLEGEGSKVIPPILEHFRFDHIFFTGSATVGKLIMGLAVKHLTPVTLELGGKSPAIIEKGFDLELTAKKLVWGKFINAGQTCVCPDYVLVHENDKEALIKCLSDRISKVFGDKIKESEHFARIIDKDKTARIASYLDECEILFGGDVDIQERYISPTIVVPIEGAKIMQTEIFGPILPILTYRTLQDVYDQVAKAPNPLSTYVFSDNSNFIDEIHDRISFGNGAVNNVVQQLGNSNLPFGGINQSGMGSYHGIYGFDTFSHLKSILSSSKYFDIDVKYHPYTSSKISQLKTLFKLS